MNNIIDTLWEKKKKEFWYKLENYDYYRTKSNKVFEISNSHTVGSARELFYEIQSSIENCRYYENLKFFWEFWDNEQKTVKPGMRGASSGYEMTREEQEDYLQIMCDYATLALEKFLKYKRLRAEAKYRKSHLKNDYLNYLPVEMQQKILKGV